MSCILLTSHCIQVTYLSPFVCQNSVFGFVLVALFPWVVSRNIDLFTVFVRTSRIWVSKTVSLCFFSIRLPFEKLEPGCQLSSWLNTWQPRGIGWRWGKKALKMMEDFSTSHSTRSVKLMHLVLFFCPAFKLWSSSHAIAKRRTQMVPNFLVCVRQPYLSILSLL